MMTDPVNHSPMEIHQHTYWNPLTHFILSVDTYPHWNVFCIESGTFEYNVLDQKGTAHFGELIICPPHIPLRRKAVTPLKFHFLRFSFIEQQDYNLLPVGKIKINDLSRLASTYHHFRNTAFREEPLYKKWKAHLLYDIIYTHFMEDIKNSVNISQTKIHDDLIVEAVHYLQKHAYENFGLKNLSLKFGLSQVQFTRRFKKSMGVTPTEYITSLRLQKAQTLLLETDYKVEDIAHQSGFSNGFYFSRVFTKRMKLSPSQFRKMHKI